MYHLKRRILPAIVAGVLGFGSAIVLADQPATQPSPSDLQAQIQQLKAQVATLQTNQQQQQADESAAVQQVVTDAQEHSELFDSTSGVTAGWDSTMWRFWVGSDDGKFLFHPGVIMQARYASSYRQSPSNFDDGFEIRRLKLYADGNIINKDTTYKVQIQNQNGPSSTAVGGNMTVEYAFLNYVFYHGSAGDLAMRVGEFKNPVFHQEEATGDMNVLLVERSLDNALVGGNSLGGPYVEGIDFQFTGNKNPLHLTGLFSNGDGSANTNFTDVTSAPVAVLGAPATVTTDKFGGSLRGDYKLFGDWVDNTDGTGKNFAKHDFLAVGGGANFSQSNTAVSTVGLVQGPPVSTATTTVNSATDSTRFDVDGTYLSAGNWIAYAEAVGFYQDYRGAVATSHHQLSGGQLIQFGYFVNPALELAARYDVTEIDHHFKTGNEDVFHEITVGANWFLGDNGAAGNHCKICTDFSYLPKGVPSQANLDYQASANGKSEVVAQVLFQLWI